MENEEKKGLRPLTNEYDLGIGQKWDRKKDFFRGKMFWIEREKRIVEKFEWKTNRVDPRVYIEIGISTNQAGIEEKSRIKAQCIERCWGGVDG